MDNIDLKTALWGDLKTDEQRANWLRLGRGFETGIIAQSLQHEVAMAFHFRAETIKDRMAVQATKTPS